MYYMQHMTPRGIIYDVIMMTSSGLFIKVLIVVSSGIRFSSASNLIY